MQYHPNSKSIVIFLCLASLFLFQGCEKKKEPPAKPKIVSKKITFDSGGSSDAGTVSTGTASASVAEPEKKDDIPETGLPEKTPANKAESGIGAPVFNVEKFKNALLENGREKMEKRFQNAVFSESSDEEDSVLAAAIASNPPVYDPEDKIDPFRPLFKDEPDESEPAITEEKKEREKRIPRTPLERIGLSQLKLVGIIQADSGNRGLVQENSGKGYIISSGTYIGTNGGRVTEILNDKVVVEEEVEDVLGKPTVQKRELKLQKPFGEN